MAEIRRFPAWVSLVEVAVFYGLAQLVIWGGEKLRPTVLLIAIVLLAVCICSNVLHGDSLRRIGLSSEELWPCARLVAIVSVPLLIPLMFFAWKNRFYAPWDTAFALLGYPLWGFVQEYALLGFVANRLEDGMERQVALVPWVNGLLFSMAHLPNPVLMTATFISGVLFTQIFLRHRQLVPIAIAHALFGIGISLAFSAINGVMSVGPGYGLRIGSPPQ